MDGIYSGRLVCDGDGNLLADEGEYAGYPVAYHEGSYVFLNPGDPSHNAKHEQNVLTVEATVDASMTDDESLVNAYEGGENAHHFDISDGVVSDPDAIASKMTGHTDAYTNGAN